MVGISEQGRVELPMSLPLDKCRDPDRGQILITIDAPSAFALVEARRGEVRDQSLLEGFFYYLSLELAVRRSSGVSPCIIADP